MAIQVAQLRPIVRSMARPGSWRLPLKVFLDDQIHTLNGASYHTLGSFLVNVLHLANIGPSVDQCPENLISTIFEYPDFVAQPINGAGRPR